ncbi:MAG: hypothetical protein IPO94_17375 [Saprospiraceae bacterium]|nr:hypothetical protein [Saprospiraceae bacterium]
MDEGDGYIIVQPNVNCQSKAGRPGLIMMDKSYQKHQFSFVFSQPHFEGSNGIN